MQTNQKPIKNEVVEKKNESQIVKLPDIGKTMLSRMVDQVSAFASIENTPLTNKEKRYASSIAMAIIKRVEESGTKWELVDVKNVVEQIKRFARLGLSINENELYIDMRNNGKTGKKDITIKKQYQGIEKELIKWCSKKIIRFYKDIICVGDEFETEVDLSVGLETVIKHVKNREIDRNKLENITGAYDIAYVEEDNKLVQYVVVIDKNRINRAYNASPTNEKPIWKADTQRMVLKTTAWCLYNYLLKPFVNIPDDLKVDWEETQDKMEFDAVEEIVAEEVKTNANTGEVIDIGEEVEEQEIEVVQEEAHPEQQNLFEQERNTTTPNKRGF
jgi:hypothetical protein